ncbi:MAG: DUF1844 domain-containing protein [Gemmatimonadota bacterium]
MTPDNRFRERRTAYQQEPEGTPPAESEAPSPPPVVESPPPPAPEATAPATVVPEPAPEPLTPPAAVDAAVEPAIDLDALDEIEIPDASFLELVQPLEIQALQFLGEIPLSPAGEKRVMPRWAKHVIDLLGILEARTQGQLAEDEAQYLKQVLADLRVRYLRISQ